MALMLGGPLEDVTVDRVAEEASVSRGLVFHYYPTVRDLHLAAITEICDQVVVQVSEAVLSAPADERLEAGLQSFAEFVLRQPKTFGTVLGFAATDAEFATVFDQVRATFVELIVAESGRELTPLLETMLWGWEAMVERCLVRWADDPSSVDRNTLIGALADGVQEILVRS